MKTTTGKFLTNVSDEISHHLRLVCGKPSPMKRFIAVLIVGGALAVGYIYFVFTGLYNIAKNDTEEKEFLRLQHIEMMKLELKKEGYQILKQDDYDEQQSNDGQE